MRLNTGTITAISMLHSSRTPPSCLPPVSFEFWGSSVADIVETQAGRPAANPTCQQTRSESVPVWDHTDRTRKTDNSAALIGAAIRNVLNQTSACCLSNFTEQNQNQLLMWFHHHHVIHTHNYSFIDFWIDASSWANTKAIYKNNIKAITRAVVKLIYYIILTSIDRHMTSS